MQVSYLPRELLEQQAPRVPMLRRLSGVNAPPPPIQRTPSRDGIHRAPAPPGVTLTPHLDGHTLFWVPNCSIVHIDLQR